MALLLRLYGCLRLKVNETKSAVASVFQRKFLGYSLWVAPRGTIKRRVADKPMAAFKQRGRKLKRRSGGRSLDAVLKQMRDYVLGWKSLFPAGRYSGRLEPSGQMGTSPDAGHPTQALETRRHGISETARLGSFPASCGASGGQ